MLVELPKNMINHIPLNSRIFLEKRLTKLRGSHLYAINAALPNNHLQCVSRIAISSDVCHTKGKRYLGTRIVVVWKSDGYNCRFMIPL